MVLNCNAGKHGFPSELSDSQILNLLLSGADHYENGEERRLFYVAMTRAKNQVYFFTNKFSPSKFITELEPTKEDFCIIQRIRFFVNFGESCILA